MSNIPAVPQSASLLFLFEDILYREGRGGMLCSYGDKIDACDYIRLISLSDL